MNSRVWSVMDVYGYWSCMVIGPVWFCGDYMEFWDYSKYGEYKDDIRNKGNKEKKGKIGESHI